MQAIFHLNSKDLSLNRKPSNIIQMLNDHAIRAD